MRHYMVTRTEIDPEMMGEYRLAISKIWQAQAKAGNAPTHVMRRRIMGNRMILHTVSGYDSGAARDKWPLFADFMAKSYSPTEIDQIMSTVQGATVSSHWFEITHRPDLSNMPAASTND